jgi:hypothetical protein
MKIVAKKLCDVIKEKTGGRAYGARPNYGLWQSERWALFIIGVKITSNGKEHLTQHLMDGDTQEYLM